MVRVAVVGAGCIGLGSAVKIKETFPDYEVVIFAKDFTPNTTGDGSGGLWYPYLCGITPIEKISKWGLETYRLYHKLWLEGGLNISLLPFYSFNRKLREFTQPVWANSVLGFQELDRKQLAYFSQLYSADFVQGHTFTTFIVPPQLILPYLTKRFEDAGGLIVETTVTSLCDAILSPFDVVVNCTGVKARNVTPDARVFAIRGQILKVDAPWVSQAIIDDDADNYILPNYKTTVLGGTHQEHNYSTKLNDDDTTAIVSGCTKLIPALKHARVIDSWAGLRPGRDETRLEAEQAMGKLYIHNYGHGGSGMTLFWGCASDVLQILKTKRSQFDNKEQLTISKL